MFDLQEIRFCRLVRAGPARKTKHKSVTFFFFFFNTSKKNTLGGKEKNFDTSWPGKMKRLD